LSITGDIPITQIIGKNDQYIGFLNGFSSRR